MNELSGEIWNKRLSKQVSYFEWLIIFNEIEHRNFLAKIKHFHKKGLSVSVASTEIPLIKKWSLKQIFI